MANKSIFLFVVNFIMVTIIYHFSFDRSLDFQGILYVWVSGLVFLLFFIYAFVTPKGSERAVAFALAIAILYYVTLTQTGSFINAVFIYTILTILTIGYLEPEIVTFTKR